MNTPETEIPAGWTRGQLLNVRNMGDRYVATLLEEEFDHRHPERAIFFAHSFDANQFLAQWYARELR